jgi:hypothetical protein
MLRCEDAIDEGELRSDRVRSGSLSTKVTKVLSSNA